MSGLNVIIVPTEMPVDGVKRGSASVGLSKPFEALSIPESLLYTEELVLNVEEEEPAGGHPINV
jgi:hypothetical protein